MTDVNGYEVEPSEAAALIEHATAEILSEPDPSVRYIMATRQQLLYTAVIDAAAAIRAESAAELHHDGMSYSQIAAQCGITRARAQQLVERGRGQK